MRLAGCLLLLLLAPGCWLYTPGDRNMVSLSADQVRRAAESVVNNLPAEALDHLQLASDALAAMNDRHGRSSKQWKRDAAEAAKQARESIGAYKSGTRTIQIIAGYARGVLGFFLNNPLRSGLMLLLPILVGALGRQIQKRWGVEKAALRTVDVLKEEANGAFTDKDGKTTAAFQKATAGLKEPYMRHRE